MECLSCLRILRTLEAAKGELGYLLELIKGVNLCNEVNKSIPMDLVDKKYKLCQYHESYLRY